MRVFEDMVLRRIFGPKQDGMTGEWRKQPIIIRTINSRRMRWAGHVTRMGEKTNVYRLLAGKPEGKISLGRPKPRWVDNIKMDLAEINGVVWTGLAWLRRGTSGDLL
jgi:hypothetical protein